MDFTILEKHKDNLIAFCAGAIVFSSITWTIAGNFHSKKVDILETSLRQSQQKLSEAQQAAQTAQLRAAAISQSMSVENAKQSRKQELNALLSSIDKQIQKKKAELIMASPIGFASRSFEDEPKGALYLQTEAELTLLQEQRNKILTQLIAGPNS